MTAHWPVEEIPADALIYMRAHRRYVDANGSLMPVVFQDHDGGMSTDWEKYAEPHHTRNRAKTPSDNGVISLNVGEARKVPMAVTHTPVQPGSTDSKGLTIAENRAHSDVVGKKSTEARFKLLRLAKWEIPVRR